MLVLEDSGRRRVCTHRSDLTVNRSGTVCHFKNVGVPSLDRAGVSASLRDAGNVDLFACDEGIGGHHVSEIEISGVLEAELLQVFLRGNSCLFEMSLCGFARMLILRILECELHSFVTVGLGGLLLCYAAGAGLDNRNGDNESVFVENLGHAQLLSDDSFFHDFLL